MGSYNRELQDIFHIPRILGTFPFDRRFRLSKRLLAYCVLVRLVSSAGALDAFVHPTPLFAKSGIGIALRSIAVVSALMDNFFNTIWWVLKRDTVGLLMDNLDQILTRTNAEPRTKRLSFIHYLLLFTVATHTFSYVIYSDAEFSLRNARNEFSHFLSASCSASFISQFWNLLYLLRLMFRKCTQLYDENSVVNYEKFMTFSENVNELYEPQVLFTLTQCFLLIIVFLYILLLPLNPGLNWNNIITLILTVNSFIPIGTIILACNAYNNEEKNFNQELRRRIVKEKTGVLLSNEKLNFHFTVGKETEFSACGFFTIDKSLICSMISAGTTYLVIVLQYGVAETNPAAQPTSPPASTTLNV